MIINVARGWSGVESSGRKRIEVYCMLLLPLSSIQGLFVFPTFERKKIIIVKQHSSNSKTTRTGITFVAAVVATTTV